MTTTAPEPSEVLEPDEAELDPRRWWTLAVLCLSLLIVFVGNSSLNVAIPTLSEELGASNSQLQWVVASYSLVFAGLLFTTGALGDRYGRKGMLQLGLVVFLLAAVASAFSGSIEGVIAGRAVMGAGAALIMPATLSILVNVFPPHERTKAIAFWAATSGGAGALGPIASGWILGHFWWGAVFLINVPFVLAALVAGHFLVPRSKDPEKQPLDPMGAVLSTVGIATLVYGLIQAPEEGWGSPVTLAAFGIAAVVLALFVAWERRVEDPMLDISLFKLPAFSAGSSGMILIFMAMYGVMFLITQYFQLILGYSALSTALRFLPMSPIMIVIATQTPKLAARFGAHRTVAAGLSLVAVGLLMFRALTVDTSYWYVLACIVPLTSGIAMAMSPMTTSIMSAVPARRAGTGSAMNDATREVGASLGIAVLGSLAASHFSHAFSDTLSTVPEALRGEASSSLAGALQAAQSLGGAAGQEVALGAQQAFVDGVHFACTIGAGLAALAAFVAFRYLPHQAVHETPLEAVELTAEVGIGGVPPLIDQPEYEGEADEVEPEQPVRS